MNKISNSKEIKNLLNIEAVNTKRIYYYINSKKSKSSLFPSEKALIVNNYYLFPADLKDSEALITKLKEFNLDFE